MADLEYPVSRELESGEVLSPAHKEDVTREQLNQTFNLNSEITFTLNILKGAKKLGVEKRSSILAKLVKANETLIKTQRLVMGMDSDTGGLINKGVIIIPGKSDNWPDAAQRELDNAKRLLSGQGGEPDSLNDEVSTGEDNTGDDDAV